jgi:hypothetical protein
MMRSLNAPYGATIILGNKVSETDGCRTQTAWNYSIGTQYAYPDSVVEGPSGNQLTTGFTYLMNAGLPASQTDWKWPGHHFQL